MPDLLLTRISAFRHS